MTPIAHTFTPNSAPVGTANSSAPASSASSSQSAADQAQSTFISLLVTELQAQDPTQPMDPTQMVSQMFSMNQLEQLISINQTLTNAFGPLTGDTAASSAASSANPVSTGGN
ncbi:MAG: flagellar hook capping FlgD N-terminal domain-containing protein [Terriglobales bacterium]